MELGIKLHDYGVPFVVCWQTRCESAAARIFVVAFFNEFNQTGDADSAFHNAKIAITAPKKSGQLDGGGARALVPKFVIEDPCAPPFSSSRPDPGAADRPLRAGVPILIRS